MEPVHDREIKETRIEKRTDTTEVMSTFIKYTAYLIIFFGIMYFLIQYVLPMF